MSLGRWQRPQILVRHVGLQAQVSHLMAIVSVDCSSLPGPVASSTVTSVTVVRPRPRLEA